MKSGIPSFGVEISRFLLEVVVDSHVDNFTGLLKPLVHKLGVLVGVFYSLEFTKVEG